MNQKQLVEKIVNTYELSEDLKNKIILRLLSILKKRYIECFDETYTFVSEFIEKYETPYREKRAIRLDPLVGGGDVSKQDLISSESIIRIDSTKRSDLNHLKFKMSKKNFGFLLYLLKTGQINKLGRKSDLNEFNIVEKVSSVFLTFEKKGKIIRVPKRIFIKNKYGKINYAIGLGARRYNGNSLRFFRDYPEVYSRMTRAQLSKLDGGLCSILSKERLLDKAIPDYNVVSYNTCKKFLANHTSYSEEDVKIMIAAFNKYGSTREASKHVPFERRTIAKYVRLEKGRIGRGNPKKPFEIREIRNLFYSCDGKITIALQNSKYSYYTIKKYWDEVGFLLEKHGRERVRNI